MKFFFELLCMTCFVILGYSKYYSDTIVNGKYIVKNYNRACAWAKVEIDRQKQRGPICETIIRRRYCSRHITLHFDTKALNSQDRFNFCKYIISIEPLHEYNVYAGDEREYFGPTTCNYAAYKWDHSYSSY